MLQVSVAAALCREPQVRDSCYEEWGWSREAAALGRVAGMGGQMHSRESSK
jgi:hypothetical protein